MVRISVVIPVYNDETYLSKAIDSVLAQTFRDFEVIVVDDGSTDGTPEVIASYGGRLRSFRKPNGGGASALNLSIRQAAGEWIAWLSSDDEWMPEKLSRQMTVADGDASAGLVYTDFVKVDSEGRILGEVVTDPGRTQNETRLRLVRGCFINGSTSLIRRDVFETLGLFDEGDRLTPDYDLWFRIVERYRVVRVPEILVRYRVRPGQASSKIAAMEHATNRVLARALRRMGTPIGALLATLCLRDRLVNLPWRIHKFGGVLGGPWAVARCFLVDFVLALVGPGPAA